MYKTLHGMKHHTQGQSTFTFCLIKLYEPLSKTILYLLNIRKTQTTCSLVSISIVIFDTAHRAMGSNTEFQFTID